jgi:hypothetical protein
MLVSPFLYDYALLEPGDRVRRPRGRSTGSRIRRTASRRPRA